MGWVIGWVGGMILGDMFGGSRRACDEGARGTTYHWARAATPANFISATPPTIRRALRRRFSVHFSLSVKSLQPSQDRSLSILRVGRSQGNGTIRYRNIKTQFRTFISCGLKVSLSCYVVLCCSFVLALWFSFVCNYIANLIRCSI